MTLFVLERAITENQLVLHFQPRLLLSTLTLRGVEVLVRWRSPDRGLVSPLDFVEAAERDGHIRDLEAWVVRDVQNSRVDDFERDRDRDNLANVHGYDVLRFTYDQLTHHINDCRRMLVAYVARRSGSARPFQSPSAGSLVG